MYLASSTRTEVFIDLLAKLDTLVTGGKVNAESAWAIAISVAKDHNDWPEEEKPEQEVAPIPVPPTSVGSAIFPPAKIEAAL